MGGASLPTASTPGYGTLTRNSRTFVGCDCVIAFVEAAEALGLAAWRLKQCLDIVQLTGNATKSAGVHRLGAAFDVKQFDDWWLHVWREMGAAFWPRTDPHPGVAGDEWDNNEHGHGGIDCPHDELIAYQMTAYWRGYSGLGQAKSGPYAGMWGYGSKDAYPWRPKTRRTWREGIAWAKQQTAAITAQEDFIVALDPAERAALIADIATAVVDRKVISHVGDPAPLRSHAAMANWRASDNQASLAIVRRMLADIAGKVGVDVDEKALAAQIVASLAPSVRDAVIAAGQPDAVADAVVAKLGAALTPPA